MMRCKMYNINKPTFSSEEIHGFIKEFMNTYYVYLSIHLSVCVPVIYLHSYIHLSKIIRGRLTGD